MKLPNLSNPYLVFGALFAVHNRLQIVGDKFYEEISTKQWFVLVGVNLFEEAPTLKELSAAIGTSYQNVKQLVLKLEQKGYLKMKRDEKDRRAIRVYTTDKCVVLEQDYRQKEETFMSMLFQDTEEKELECTLKTLLKVEENLKKMEDNL